MKYESSTRTWFIKYTLASLSSVAVCAFCVLVHPFMFACSLWDLFALVSSFKSASALAFADLPARYRKNTFLFTWNHSRYCLIYLMGLSVWLQYWESGAKSVKYQTQVIAFLNSCSCPAVRRCVPVLRRNDVVKTHKITIRIDRISFPESWLKNL